MSATPTRITHTQDGDVAVLLLDGADRLNAIASSTAFELAELAQQLQADGTTRAVVLHGAGRAFSAGADIEQISGFRSRAEFWEHIGGLTDALEMIETSPLPFIAAIHGVAYGGGLELALACDLRIAAPDSRLGLPEAKLGMLPGAGGTQRLPRLVPRGVATEMLMTGASVTGERAAELGLVNRLVQGSLLEDAVAFAREITVGAPQVAAATKSLRRDTEHLGLVAGIAREREVVADLFDTRDGREGFAAFVERRPPVFGG